MNEENYKYIGSFKIERLNGIFLNEDSVGIFNNVYNVYVNPSDGGMYAHLHVKNKNETFHTCIMLDVPEYFHHEGKRDSFNSKERKEFNKFMMKENKKQPEKSNWECAVEFWNDNNSIKIIDISKVKQPDYTKLPVKKG